MAHKAIFNFLPINWVQKLYKCEISVATITLITITHYYHACNYRSVFYLYGKSHKREIGGGEWRKMWARVHHTLTVLSLHSIIQFNTTLLSLSLFGIGTKGSIQNVGKFIFTVHYIPDKTSLPFQHPDTYLHCTKHSVFTFFFI